MARLRTFIAVETPDDVQAALRRLIAELSTDAAAVRWVRPENVHLTLKFLGDVDETEIHRVCHSARDAAEGSVAFQVPCIGVGAFPSPARPRTVWVGIQDPEGLLDELHRRLEKTLRPLGFPREKRKYHPHLTLGRLRYNRRGGDELREQIEQQKNLEIGTLDVRRLVVFSSDLTPDGPVYTALARCPLANG